jgi:hypothetical protein
MSMIFQFRSFGDGDGGKNSTMQDQTLTEASACLHGIRELLRGIGPQLQHAGIQAKFDYIEPEANAEEYEISIWLWADGDVLDVIEFFVVYEGKMVAPSEELISWTRKELEQIVTTRKKDT